MTYDTYFVFKRLRDPFAAQKQAYEVQHLDELTEVKVEGSDIRVTIADVAPAIVIGRRKETTGIGGLTFQTVKCDTTDAAIVQHVTEGTIVISVAGQCGCDEQSVRHDGLLRFVCL